MSMYVFIQCHNLYLFIYSHVCVSPSAHMACTENHRTENSFQRHVILKSFPILGANYYIILVYIAFVQRNMDELAIQVATFFIMTSIADVVLGFGWKYV